MTLTRSRVATAAVAALALTLLAAGTAAGAAAQAPPPTGTVVSTCNNPVLNTDLAGWGRIGGSAPFRYPLTDHADATAAYVQANNPAANPRAYLPQMPVTGGEKWTFATDARTDVPGTGRVAVDWYSTPDGDNTGYLGQAAGPAVPLPAATPAAWYRVAGDFTAPPAAVRANVLAVGELPAGSDFSLTGCDYRPTAGEPTEPPAPTTLPAPTTQAPPETTTPAPPPTTPPTPGDGTSAAVARGWGTPVAGDEFNYIGRPDSRWGLYDGPGHAGRGVRSPGAFSVDGTKLTVSGDANGTTGGMAYRGGQYRGKWEARMRVPRGDSEYHPVLILWPDAEDFPVGGEVDYAETTTASSQIDFFLHYGSSNSQTHGQKTLDLTAWHNYATSWDANCITGYVDNQQFFQDCNTSHLPPRPMHMTVQLDWFPDGSATTPSQMQVDWIRQYRP